MRCPVLLAIGYFFVFTPARAEGVAAAYLGGARTEDSSLLLEQASRELRLDPLRYRTESFTPPLYYGYRLGYFLSRIGLEVEFIHAKVIADTERPVTVQRRDSPVAAILRLKEVVERFEISHGMNFLLFNLVVRQPLRSASRPLLGRMAVTGRFGLGPTIPHAESTIAGIRREGYEVGSLGLQLAGGTEVRLWRGLHGFGEYKFIRTDQDVPIGNGRAQTLLRTHQGVLGLAYHFR